MVLVTVGAAAPPAGGEDQVATGAPISLRLEDAGLADVLVTFSKITELHFVVVPEVNRYDLLNQTVSVVFDQTPWDTVLDEILSDAGLEWTLEGTVLWIHPPSQAPDGNRHFTGDPISLKLEGADVRKVITVLSEQTGRTFNLDPSVSSQISVQLEDVPWDQALDLILRISGLAYSRNNDAFEIYPVTDARGMQLLPARESLVAGQFESERVYRYKKFGPVSEPKKISGPTPEYTDEARAEGISGKVVVKILIDAQGQVASAEPLMELSHGLTEKAIEAIERWIFEPATLDGEPVPVEYIVSTTFDLE
jgi:TonB family protein